MSMDKNQEALALAFKRARAKSLKIKELAIEPDMAKEAIEELVEVGAKDKAERMVETDWTQYVKGQRWYIEDLIEFSGLSPQERLNHEYDQCFADVASEAEMLATLEGLV